jgi:hypothetical protein
MSPTMKVADQTLCPKEIEQLQCRERRERKKRKRETCEAHWRSYYNTTDTVRKILTMIEANHIFHLKTSEQLQWKEKGEKKKGRKEKTPKSH